MGDPLSPAMTIGTCAWMESDWMEGLDQRDKEYFTARRYMDDILMCYAESEKWDHEKFVEDFISSTCYHPPLELEDGAEGTYLETTFRWEGTRFAYKLKNENEAGKEPKIWRYKDFRSHAPFAQKRALITMLMKKVHGMASDRAMLTESAIQKISEFKRLNYPRGLLRGVCNYMYATTREGGWMDARDKLLG